MKALRLELYKSRRRMLPLVVLSMAVVQGLWLMWSLSNQSMEARAQGYAGCLYQFPLLSAITMPIAIAVLVSRLCDMEHRGACFKALLPLQSAQSLFNAKLMCAAVYLLLGVLLQLGMIVAAGSVYGFTDSLALSDALSFILGQYLTGLFLVLLIQTLALKYANQFIPLVAGLVAALLGLMSMFFSPWVMRLVPSAYYGLLSVVRLDWDAATRIGVYYHQAVNPLDYMLMIAATIALYFAGRAAFIKREV